MAVPPLRPISNFNSCISGEVTVHPTALIGPGVLLQASPNSRIVIGAGVCIGMGAILQAYEGTIEVEAGATLGAGVLVIGQGKIGTNACIGSVTTIFNHSVEAGQVIGAGAIIGDTSRQIAEAVTSAPPPPAESAPPQPQSQSDYSNHQVIYGQVSVKRLLYTLFPSSQSLNKPLSGNPADDSSQNTNMEK